MPGKNQGEVVISVTIQFARTPSRALTDALGVAMKAKRVSDHGLTLAIVAPYCPAGTLARVMQLCADHGFAVVGCEVRTC